MTNTTNSLPRICIHPKMDEAVTAVMKELPVSESCAFDIVFLRTQTNKHTPELEKHLIALHEAGLPPNWMY